MGQIKFKSVCVHFNLSELEKIKNKSKLVHPTVLYTVKMYTVQSFHLKKNTGQRNHYYYHEHAKATRSNAGGSEAYKYKTQSDAFLSKRKGSKFLKI